MSRGRRKFHTPAIKRTWPVWMIPPFMIIFLHQPSKRHGAASSFIPYKIFLVHVRSIHSVIFLSVGFT